MKFWFSVSAVQFEVLAELGISKEVSPFGDFGEIEAESEEALRDEILADPVWGFDELEKKGYTRQWLIKKLS